MEKKEREKTHHVKKKKMQPPTQLPTKVDVWLRYIF